MSHEPGTNAVPAARTYGGNQPASAFEADLGLPDGFCSRAGSPDELAEAAVDWLANAKPPGQNHWPALALAIVTQAEVGLASLGEVSLDDVFGVLAVPERTARGATVHTLNFIISDAPSVKLRPQYTRALNVIHSGMRRFEHPSNPGYATRSWRDYTPFIERVWATSPTGRRAIVDWVWDHGVLPIPESQTVAAVDRSILPFEKVLGGLPTASRRPGSVWQGICYGYLRADSPNVQLESNKAQAGGRRAGLLGDVDGFVGDRVVLAAECKDLVLDSDWRNHVGEFLNQVGLVPGVTSIVMCADIEPGARAELAQAGLLVLTRETMRRTVAVWDEPKQWSAIQGLFYYLRRIQKHEGILAQVKEWCVAYGILGADADAELDDAEAAAVPEDAEEGDDIT